MGANTGGGGEGEPVPEDGLDPISLLRESLVSFPRATQTLAIALTSIGDSSETDDLTLRQLKDMVGESLRRARESGSLPEIGDHGWLSGIGDTVIEP